MKIVLQIAALLVAVHAFKEQEQWNLFKSKFTKSYTNQLEEKERYDIFTDNLALINSHNKQYEAGLISYKMAVNQFADLTKSEFVSMLNRQTNLKGSFGSSIRSTFKGPLGAKIPPHRNWTEIGAVTSVKNQGDCGSGWSFSAVGCIEGQYLKKEHKLMSFSAQNLIDCSQEYKNNGCDGGLPENAFDYMQKVGIMSDEEYSYQGVGGTCKFDSSKSILQVKKIFEVESGSEPLLKHAVGLKGPTSVSVDASNFAFYSEGIFDDAKCGNTTEHLNHGVLAVGYDTLKDGTAYWLIKNSWGTHWGEGGYMRMSRYKDNQCGIATLPTYVEIK